MPHLPDTHHDHDPALIAAFAAGDATGAELSLASELVAACTACASLHDDLVTIAAAVHALPAPRRSRDYRLTGEQAGRLRPSGWRRFVAPFGGPRFRLAAPLGTTMATLGVAGLLLAAMPGATPTAERSQASGPDPFSNGGGVMITGSSAQPDPSDLAAAPGSPAGASASAPAASSGQQPDASPTTRRETTVTPLPAATPTLDSATAPFPASPAWQSLALASAVLFMLGAALVLGRLVARRLTAV